MTIGTVKFFDAAKGFGFIIPEGGGKDIFVHKSALDLAGIATLSQGQYVSFETEANARGAVAAAQLKQHFNESVPAVINEGAMASTISENNSERKTNHNFDRRPPFTTFGKAHTTTQSSSIQNPKSPNKFGEWKRNYDRYSNLAQNSDNDSVMREHYWQYAEHFLRMMNGSST